MPPEAEKPSPGTETPHPKTPANEEETVMVPDQEEHQAAQRQWWVVILALAALAAVVLWLIGRAQRGELWSAFRDVLDQEPQFELVESRDGVVLLVRNEKNRSEVLVQLASEVGWRYISTNDFTARNPALSLSGDQVAYLSGKDDVHIKVVSLISNTQMSVTATIIDTPLSGRQLTGLSVCLWSPVRWSPDGARLAFFACTQEPVVSYAVVVDLLSDPPKIVWVEEGKLAQEERSLIWLDSTRLLISIPTSDDKGMAIETVKVDP